MSPHQRQLPGVDALIQEAANTRLHPPLTDIVEALVVDSLGFGHLRGEEGDSIPESEHVTNHGAYLSSNKASHSFVDEVLCSQGRGGIEKEAAIVVVEQGRQ